MPIFEDPVRNYFSLYKGKGSVFAVIAQDKKGMSAYVPAASLGCDVTAVVDEICDTSSGTSMELFCVIIMFYGIFVCYFGQRLFMTTLFFFGAAAGVFISGISMVAINGYTLEECILISGFFGIVWGFMWVFLWKKYGIPFVSASLSCIAAGVLWTSVIYYSGFRK